MSVAFVPPFCDVTIALTTTNPILQLQMPSLPETVLPFLPRCHHGSYQIQAADTAKRVTTLPFREDMHCNICLVTAKNAQLSPVGQAFKDFTLQYFQKA